MTYFYLKNSSATSSVRLQEPDGEGSVSQQFFRPSGGSRTMDWTTEKLAAMSPQDRATLYGNPLRAGSDERRKLAKLISDAGLPFSENGGISMDHPLVQAMRAIVQSPEARTACIETSKMVGPRSRVWTRCSPRHFQSYGKHKHDDQRRGALVADLMRESGIQDGRQGRTDPGRVHRKSGELWTHE